MIAEEYNNKINKILNLQVWWQSHIQVQIKAGFLHPHSEHSSKAGEQDQLIHRWLDGKYGDISDEQAFPAEVTK